MAIAIVAITILFISQKSQSTELDKNITLSNGPLSDIDLLEFPLNLEFLEAEFFLFGALGYGLDRVAPKLTKRGPPPLGARHANLDVLTRDVILQFGWREVGHLRAIQNIVKGFPRPLMDLSPSSFAKIMNLAFGRTLSPPFDPYTNQLNFLIASYVVPYVGLIGYVGANPKLKAATSKKLVAGLLGVESGQDAVIRTLLYRRASMRVEPYGITVAEFTNRISELRNKLGYTGLKDEGLVSHSSKGLREESREMCSPETVTLFPMEELRRRFLGLCTEVATKVSPEVSFPTEPRAESLNHFYIQMSRV